MFIAAPLEYLGLSRKVGPLVLSPNIKLKEITEFLNSDLGGKYRTLPFYSLSLENLRRLEYF